MNPWKDQYQPSQDHISIWYFSVGQKEKKYGGWDNQQLQDYSDNPMDKPNGMPFK